MNTDQLLILIANIVRVGTVSSVNKPERTAKVIFQDRCSTFVSGDLKVIKSPPFIPEKDVLQRTEYESGGSGEASFENHKHDLIITPWLPDIGETVLCLYLGCEGGDGFVLGGI